MEPEVQIPVQETPAVAPDAQTGLEAGSEAGAATGSAAEAEVADTVARPVHDLAWVAVGEDGLRSGWSIVLFGGIGFLFLVMFRLVVDSLLKAAHLTLTGGMSPLTTIASETILVLALAGAAALVARIEGRRLRDFYLGGRRSWTHFAAGLGAGFLALSALVGLMTAGGWLTFGAPALAGAEIARYAALWAVGFLLVGCFEEGLFRGYLQFTLTRGINFWIALAMVAGLAARIAFNAKASGGGGVYAAALLGLAPCAWVHWKRIEGGGFWQAAWATSTLFGFIHTGNNGESWIGIFAAATIGFVFCVSIRVTGSVWWAIGCHASWDWAETYFYGTADSGLAARGHLLTTTPAGNVLFSGGEGGPEASLLALPVIALLLGAIVVLYGRRGRTAAAEALGE